MSDSAARLERFLARIYTDDVEHSRFLADPRGVAMRAGLDHGDVERLANLDLAALALATASLAAKRARKIP